MLKKLAIAGATVVVAAAVPTGGVLEGIHEGHNHAVKDQYGHVHTVGDEAAGGAAGGLGGLLFDAGAGIGAAYLGGRRRGKKVGYEAGFEAGQKAAKGNVVS